jgi:hypothetical protein
MPIRRKTTSVAKLDNRRDSTSAAVPASPHQVVPSAPNKDVVDINQSNVDVLIGSQSPSRQKFDESMIPHLTAKEGTISPEIDSTEPSDPSLMSGLSRLLQAGLLSDQSNPETMTIDYFYKVVLRLAGSEVEAREVQVGTVIGPNPGARSDLVLVDRLTISESGASLQTSDVALPVFREQIIGRAQGTPKQAVVVLDPIGSPIHGLYEIAMDAKDATDMYKEFTNGHRRYSAIWVKPASTVRIFKAGEFKAQVIRLRDGFGWSIRLTHDIASHMFEAIKSKLDSEMDPSIVTHACELMMELSETRHGGAMYFVENEECFDAMYEAGQGVLGKGTTGPHRTRGLAGQIRVSDRRTEQGNARLESQKRETLINMLSEDGAVVVTSDGSLVASRTYFIGPGGRRSIARELCRNPGNRIAAIVCSQDGPLFIAGSVSGLYFVDEQRYLGM